MPGQGSQACPKIPVGQLSRRESKRTRRTQEALQMRACYLAVDERDDGRCRVCRARGNPRALGLLERLHHHHLIYRSMGGVHETFCVLTICASCHDEIHVRGTLRLEGDADERDERGRLAGVAVSRLTESGWSIDKWV